jgi:hypothetical protein
MKEDHNRDIAEEMHREVQALLCDSAVAESTVM